MHEIDISVNVLKESMVIFSNFLLNYFNNIIDPSSFPNHFRLANVTPIHKKDSQNNKRNYQPVLVITFFFFFLYPWHP